MPKRGRVEVNVNTPDHEGESPLKRPKSEKDGQLETGDVTVTGLTRGEAKFVKAVNTVIQTMRTGSACCLGDNIAPKGSAPTCHWDPVCIRKLRMSFCAPYRAWIAKHCPDILRCFWRQLLSGAMTLLELEATGSIVLGMRDAGRLLDLAPATNSSSSLSSSRSVILDSAVSGSASQQTNSSQQSSSPVLYSSYASVSRSTASFGAAASSLSETPSLPVGLDLRDRRDNVPSSWTDDVSGWSWTSISVPTCISDQQSVSELRMTPAKIDERMLHCAWEAGAALTVLSTKCVRGRRVHAEMPNVGGFKGGVIELLMSLLTDTPARRVLLSNRHIHLYHTMAVALMVNLFGNLRILPSLRSNMVRVFIANDGPNKVLQLLENELHAEDRTSLAFEPPGVRANTITDLMTCWCAWPTQLSNLTGEYLQLSHFLKELVKLIMVCDHPQWRVQNDLTVSNQEAGLRIGCKLHWLWQRPYLPADLLNTLARSASVEGAEHRAILAKTWASGIPQAEICQRILADKGHHSPALWDMVRARMLADKGHHSPVLWDMVGANVENGAKIAFDVLDEILLQPVCSSSLFRVELASGKSNACKSEIAMRRNSQKPLPPNMHMTCNRALQDRIRRALKQLRICLNCLPGENGTPCVERMLSWLKPRLDAVIVPELSESVLELVCDYVNSMEPAIKASTIESCVQRSLLLQHLVEFGDRNRGKLKPWFVKFFMMVWMNGIHPDLSKPPSTLAKTSGSTTISSTASNSSVETQQNLQTGNPVFNAIPSDPGVASTNADAPKSDGNKIKDNKSKVTLPFVNQYDGILASIPNAQSVFCDVLETHWQRVKDRSSGSDGSASSGGSDSDGSASE
jgi:hypothetical protein